MNTREKIIYTITANQPKLVSLPEIHLSEVVGYEDNFAQFKVVLESIGGKVESINDIALLKDKLISEKASGNFIINTIAAIGIVDNYVATYTALELEKLEKVYIKGSTGVAENGAVWIYKSQMINRLLPFICQHLVLVIDKKDIVATMRHAYESVDVDKEGFGTFIAGPSKTANIEQSLVMGRMVP